MEDKSELKAWRVVISPCQSSPKMLQSEEVLKMLHGLNLIGEVAGTQTKTNPTHGGIEAVMVGMMQHSTFRGGKVKEAIFDMSLQQHRDGILVEALGSVDRKASHGRGAKVQANHGTNGRRHWAQSDNALRMIDGLFLDAVLTAATSFWQFLELLVILSIIRIIFIFLF